MGWNAGVRGNGNWVADDLKAGADLVDPLTQGMMRRRLEESPMGQEQLRALKLDNNNKELRNGMLARSLQLQPGQDPNAGNPAAASSPAPTASGSAPAVPAPMASSSMPPSSPNGQGNPVSGGATASTAAPLNSQTSTLFQNAKAVSDQMAQYQTAISNLRQRLQQMTANDPRRPALEQLWTQTNNDANTFQQVAGAQANAVMTQMQKGKPVVDPDNPPVQIQGKVNGLNVKTTVPLGHPVVQNLLNPSQISIGGITPPPGQAPISPDQVNPPASGGIFDWFGGGAKQAPAYPATTDGGMAPASSPVTSAPNHGSSNQLSPTQAFFRGNLKPAPNSAPEGSKAKLADGNIVVKANGKWVKQEATGAPDSTGTATSDFPSDPGESGSAGSDF